MKSRTSFFDAHLESVLLDKELKPFHAFIHENLSQISGFDASSKNQAHPLNDSFVTEMTHDKSEEKIIQIWQNRYRLRILSDLLFSNKSQDMYWKMLSFSNTSEPLNTRNQKKSLAKLMFGKTISKTNPNEQYLKHKRPNPVHKGDYDFPIYQHSVWNTRYRALRGGYHRWSLTDGKVLINKKDFFIETNDSSEEYVYLPIISLDNLSIDTLMEKYLHDHKDKITIFQEVNERIIFIRFLENECEPIVEKIKSLGLTASPWEISKYLVKEKEKESIINNEMLNFDSRLSKLTQLEKETLQTVVSNAPKTINDLKESAIFIELSRMAVHSNNNPAKYLACCLHRLISGLQSEWNIDEDAIGRIFIFLSIGMLFHSQNYDRFAFVLHAITHEISLILNQIIKNGEEVTDYKNFEEDIIRHYMSSMTFPFKNDQTSEFSAIAAPANSGCHAFILALEFVRKQYNNPTILGFGPVYYELASYVTQKFNPFEMQDELADIYCISSGPICGKNIHPGVDINAFIEKLMGSQFKKRTQPITIIIDTTSGLEKNLALNETAQQLAHDGKISILCVESCQKFGLAHTDQVQGGIVFGLCSKQLFDQKAIEQFRNNAKNDFMNNLDMIVFSFIHQNTNEYLKKIKERHFKNGALYKDVFEEKNTPSVSGANLQNKDEFLFIHIYEFLTPRLFSEASHNLDLRQGFGHYNTTISWMNENKNKGIKRLSPGASDAMDTLMELVQLKIATSFNKKKQFYFLNQFINMVENKIQKNQAIHLSHSEEIFYVSLLLSLKNLGVNCAPECSTKDKEVLLKGIDYLDAYHTELIAHRKSIQTLQAFKVSPRFFEFNEDTFCMYLDKLPMHEVKEFMEYCYHDGMLERICPGSFSLDMLEDLESNIDLNL